MRVQLIKAWFAPGRVSHLDKMRTSSGQRYRGLTGPENGIHEMPDAYRPFLPKSAVVLEDDEKPMSPEDRRPPEGDKIDSSIRPQPLPVEVEKPMDLARASGDAVDAAHKQAEDTTERDANAAAFRKAAEAEAQVTADERRANQRPDKQNKGRPRKDKQDA